MIEAMVLAMERSAGFDIFNIGRGVVASVKEILATILELEGYAPAGVRFDPAKPTTFPIRLVDTAKAERVLGFQAKVDLRDGLARTIAAYRRARKIPLSESA